MTIAIKERNCSCRGNNPVCQLCDGSGTYEVPGCRSCDGRGKDVVGARCMNCRGSGEALLVDDLDDDHE